MSSATIPGNDRVPLGPSVPSRLLHRPDPVKLHTFTDQRREAARALAEREPGFDALHDDDTLAYDVFWEDDGRHIRLICPPFLNLRDDIEAMTVRALPSGTRLTFRVRNLFRHAQIVVEAPEGTTALDLETAFGRTSVTVGESRCGFFDGHRVHLTHSKNNRLEWLQDWARFNRDIHGTTGVLVYDNGSTDYTAADVLEALSKVAGLQRIAVVDWPFKFGPQGDRFGRKWESFYFQIGMLEDARYRFLQRARSVVTGDIDELVVTADSRSLFDHAEAAPFGVVTYHGCWIVGSSEAAAAATAPVRRHRHYDLRIKPRFVRRMGLFKVDADRCLPKYAIVPRRCPQHALWDVHRIRGWLPGLVPSPGIGFRHFRPISNSWKYDRATDDHAPADTMPDEPWIAARSKVRWED